MIYRASVTLYSLRDPLDFKYAPAPRDGGYGGHCLLKRTNSAPLPQRTSASADALVVIEVPRDPAAPPWVRTRVLPPLIRSAQRLERAPWAVGRRRKVMAPEAMAAFRSAGVITVGRVIMIGEGV